jgi:hypothetical protein
MSIKANELRIGNFVKLQGVDKPFKVFLIDTTESSTFTKAEPIPLTEEWLLKFGFDDIKEIDNTDFKEYRMFNKYSFCIQFPCGIEAHCYAGNYPIAIKYVHSLQNLYFVLTNQELEIKR